jgi:hypothetical protein
MISRNTMCLKFLPARITPLAGPARMPHAAGWPGPHATRHWLARPARHTLLAGPARTPHAAGWPGHCGNGVRVRPAADPHATRRLRSHTRSGPASPARRTASGQPARHTPPPLRAGPSRRASCGCRHFLPTARASPTHPTPWPAPTPGPAGMRPPPIPPPPAPDPHRPGRRRRRVRSASGAGLAERTRAVRQVRRTRAPVARAGSGGRSRFRCR